MQKPNPEKFIFLSVILLLMPLLIYTFNSQGKTQSTNSHRNLEPSRPPLLVSQPQSQSSTANSPTIASHVKDKAIARTFNQIFPDDARRPSSFPSQKLTEFFGNFSFPLFQPVDKFKDLMSEFKFAYTDYRYAQYLASDGNYYLIATPEYIQNYYFS